MRISLAKLRKGICFALLAASTAAFVSCASDHQPARLVDDPDAQRYDSAIPWNHQEKWEQGEAVSQMMDQAQQGNGIHY